MNSDNCHCEECAPTIYVYSTIHGRITLVISPIEKPGRSPKEPTLAATTLRFPYMRDALLPCRRCVEAAQFFAL